VWAVARPDRKRSRVFGEVADQYDRARPSYPAALVDDLVAADVQRVLDVGCGTGIAARLFIARGCDVIGVEPDERMAAVARRHGVDVDVTTFERWEARGQPFDLVTAGQSWHWVDPDVGPALAASVLRPGGRLALFWNLTVHDADVAALFHDVYTQYAPSLLDDSVALGTILPGEGLDFGFMASIDASGRFEPAAARTYERRETHTTEEWIDQVATHSDHRLLDADVRTALFRALASALHDFGGVISVLYVSPLITAVRA
jgi:SAM-dependent methyltransferase